MMDDLNTLAGGKVRRQRLGPLALSVSGRNLRTANGERSKLTGLVIGIWQTAKASFSATHTCRT